MNHLKTFLVISCILFGCQSLHACGPELEPYGYRLLESVSTGPSQAFASFGLRGDDLLPGYDQFLGYTMLDENIAEWRQKFCSAPDSADIYELVYEASVEDLEMLHLAITNKGSGPFLNNELADMMVANGCLECVEYLIYTRRCQPLVNNNTEFESEAIRLSTMRQVMEEGLRIIPEVTSHWVRLRYLYQVIRLAHYMGDSQLTVDLYKKWVPRIDKRVKSGVYYWVMGHYAGAMMSLGYDAEAAALFAEVFAHSPGKRLEAFRSFRIKNQATWDRAFFLCKHDDRAAMFGIRAMMPDAKATYELDSIYALTPDHPLLDIIIIHELQQLEKEFLGAGLKNPWDTDEQANFDRMLRTDKTYLNQLRERITKFRKEGKLRSPELWQFADAYAQFLAGDFNNARLTLKNLDPKVAREKRKRNGASSKRFDGLERQILMLNLLIDLQTINEPSSKTWLSIAKISKDTTITRYFPDLERYCNHVLTTRLLQARRPGLALVARYGFVPLYYNPHDPLMQELLATTIKNDQETVFERQLLTLQGTDAADLLLEIRGTYFLGRGLFGEALSHLKRISPAYWTGRDVLNPFRDTLTHYIEDRGIVDKRLYTRLEVAEILDSLQKAVQAQPINNAQAYYKLGLACQNMSYFGEAWETADFYRSGTTWGRLADGEVLLGGFGQPLGNLENTDALTRLSMSYLESARMQYRNPEGQARSACRLAMVEHNRYYIESGITNFGYNQIPDFPETHQRYTRLLIDNYSNSQTFQTMVQTCLYFRKYASR
jgi:hypothetical protein